MIDGPVVFIDSGIGGLPYYRWVADHAPLRELIYIADTAHFPYGVKSPKTLLSLSERLVGTILETFDPALLVLSCNTLSVAALSHLRAVFNVPMVGVVPAVKPAAERSANKSIGVIATLRTIEDDYLAQLITQFASGLKVHPYGANDLVDFVETRILTAKEAEKEQACLKPITFFKEAGIDALVLGCTHFILLKDTFERLLGPRVQVIDSVGGVGAQVLRLLGEPQAKGSKTSILDGALNSGVLYTTGGVRESYRGYAKYFGLTYGGGFTIKGEEQAG